MDLVGESQLVQKRYNTSGNPTVQFNESILDVASAGYIERDQQGAVNLYNYNYWSSPVGAKNTSSNNMPITLLNNKMDGTTSSNPKPINWLASGYNASAPNPVSIPEYWLWSYENYASNTYYQWVKLNKTSSIKAGLGYTMKGSGSTSYTYQNYTFTGKPNNNTIYTPITIGNDALIGNPYPSAIDAREFIKDNIPLQNPNGSVNNAANPNTSGSIDGTLYYWIHFDSNNTHVLRNYQGGYATYTIVGGVSPPTGEKYNTVDNFYISGAGTSTLIPKDYIPVGQGFFTVSASAFKLTNNIKFENDQREFVTEQPATNSIFLKSGSSKNTKGYSSAKPPVDENDIRRVRLIYSTPEGARRYLLLAFTPDNSASDNFDYGYDAKVFENNPNDMLFMIDNDKYVIQGVGEFDESKKYPIGFFSKTGGPIEVAVSELENMPANAKVYIYDSLLETYTKINDKNSKYETTLDAGNYLNRFFITFAKENNSLSAPDELFDNIIINYLQISKEIFIKIPNGTDVKQVYLTNMLGQTITSWNETNTPSFSNEMKIPISRNIAEGTYIMNVQTSSGTINKKIIIKK
jgi:hypothetical protein